MSEQAVYQEEDFDIPQEYQQQQQQIYDQDVGINLIDEEEPIPEPQHLLGQFMPIDQIKDQGFNEKDIEKLKACGIHTLDQAAHMSDKALIATNAITDTKLPKLRALIAEHCHSTHFIRASDLLKARQSMVLISTHSAQMDNLLGGGVELGSITEIYGEFNTGKTQFCHTLAVSAQIARSKGGSQGRVLYIDSEGTFRPERIVEIARAIGGNHEQILDNILVARAMNSDHQTSLLKEAAAQFAVSRFSLLIVDSATSLFRTDYVGRGQLSERQTSLGKFLRQLHALAQTYNVAVVVTNQVVSDIAGAASMGGGDNKKPIGGNIMAHASTTRLQFRKGKNGGKICRIMDSPMLAEGEAAFKIASAGIVDADFEGE